VTSRTRVWGGRGSGPPGPVSEATAAPPDARRQGVLGSALREIRRRFDATRVLRIDPAAGSPALDRSRIFVLPTRHGLTFAVLLLVMLLSSINYNNSLGLLLTFLLAGLGVVSILHTYHNLAGLAFRAGRAAPVFAGQTASFALVVANGSGGRRWGLNVRGVERAGAEAVADAPPGLSSVAVERPAPARGRQPLGRLVIETRFPLGLFRAWAYMEPGLQCVVYPTPAPPRAWPTDGGYGTADSGEKGRGHGDFSGLRAYRPGDPTRQIHWRISARSQILWMKQFGGGAPAELWLDWDDLSGLGTEARLSQLCRWALDAQESGWSWGLRLPDSEIGVASGAAHLHRCLTALAEFPGR